MKKPNKPKRFSLIAYFVATALLLAVAGCAPPTEVKRSETTAAAEPAEAATAELTTVAETTAVPDDAARAASGSAATAAKRAFTDDAGREVALPEKIAKAAASGPMAQVGLFAAAPDKLAGTAAAWTDDAKAFIPAKYLSLPVLGQLYGGKGSMNLEELLAAAPDVVVDIGEPKKTIVEDLDQLQSQTGIPFVHISAYLNNLGQTYRRLGELLGEDTGRMADYCDRVYGKSAALAKKLGGENAKTKILYCRGDKGLNIIAKTSFHGEVLDLMADNLGAAGEVSFSGDGNEVDFEQILNWNPEAILFAPHSIYSTVGADAAWQKLDAVAGGRYYEVPASPYNWVTDPPSVQRILGLTWISGLLYPQDDPGGAKPDIVEYFKLFYHVDLSDEMYDGLVKNSLGKERKVEQ